MKNVHLVSLNNKELRDRIIQYLGGLKDVCSDFDSVNIKSKASDCVDTFTFNEFRTLPALQGINTANELESIEFISCIDTEVDKNYTTRVYVYPDSIVNMNNYRAKVDVRVEYDADNIWSSEWKSVDAPLSVLKSYASNLSEKYHINIGINKQVSGPNYFKDNDDMFNCCRGTTLEDTCHSEKNAIKWLMQTLNELEDSKECTTDGQ